MQKAWHGWKIFVEVALRKANCMAISRACIGSWYSKTPNIERELTPQSNWSMNRPRVWPCFGIISLIIIKESFWSKAIQNFWTWHEPSSPDFDEYETLIVPEWCWKNDTIRKRQGRNKDTTKKEYRIQRPNGEIRDLMFNHLAKWWN
jgi:hypothetical protein